MHACREAGVGGGGQAYTLIFLLEFANNTHQAEIMGIDQQQTRLGAKVLGTSVLEYQFCSARRYSVLVLLKSTCTRTCTQVLLKMKVLLTSTYEYFTSTSHFKLI